MKAPAIAGWSLSSRPVLQRERPPAAVQLVHGLAANLDARQPSLARAGDRPIPALGLIGLDAYNLPFSD